MNIGAVAPALQLLYVIMMYIVSGSATFQLDVCRSVDTSAVRRSTRSLSRFGARMSTRKSRWVSRPIYLRAIEARSSRGLVSGVYDEDFDEDDDEVESRFRKSPSATGYIGYHARKQLAFDLWWLALAVWLICIIERGAINSGDLP